MANGRTEQVLSCSDWQNFRHCTASYSFSGHPLSRRLMPVTMRPMTTTTIVTGILPGGRFVLRRTICIATFAVLTGLAIVPVRAEDLSRWVWVASALQEDPASEAIPTPQQAPLECPTLDQLGYRTKQLMELSLDIGIREDRLPADCSGGVFQATAAGYDGRSWCATEFNWSASDLFAQPAYFDDPLLERYGQTRHSLVQPWLSGAHFFGQFPLMPYKIVVDRPFDKVYALGYYRPGSPLPCQTRRLPRPWP